MVPTRRLNVHSYAEKNFKEIPWRIAKGVEVGCGL
jgi:hypothetical protein